MAICFVITDPTQKMPFHKPHAFDIMMLPRGDISTKLYLANVDKYKYDSFVFGSSRATAHTSKTWKTYLDKNSVPFSFGGWNESIIAIYRRIKLIDSINKPINNAFFVLDIDWAFNNGPIISDHYLITGKSKYRYYLDDYITYLQSPMLILTSVDYKIFHKKRAYMEGFIGMQENDWDPVNNDWMVNSEAEINADSVKYYKGSLASFYKRPAIQQFSRRRIDETSKNYLRKIMGLLKKHHTSYKIVIAPLYDQVKLNRQDRKTMNDIFGSEQIYDYSGINDITNNMFNFNSDVLHYRKKVGDLIFKEIYRPDQFKTDTSAVLHH